jgi:hypothetical protein
MRKRTFKIAGVALIVLAGLAGVIITSVVIFLPNVPVEEKLIVDMTPERVAHGKYLAHHVTMCMDCHSQRDKDRYAGPLIEGTEGQGGKVFNLPVGKVVAPNITPYALREWTDGELLRAITAGVSRDGRPLFPLMPYEHFGKMDREDIYDIIAFLRSLPPVATAPEKTDLHFPMSLIVHTIPGAGTPGARPSPSDAVAYGRYMVNAADCIHCHTRSKDGKAIPGTEFGGGFVIPLGNGRTVTTANISPDMETGIGSWTSDMFLHRFKSCLDSSYTHPVTASDHQTEMPWTFYAGMEERDLRAIYAYLRTVAPVKNKVSPFASSH